MTPGQKKRARARRIRKRANIRRLRFRAMDENAKEYVKCGFCTSILIFNPDLSYQELGISHDGGSPRMCGICMNQMDHPVEKWLQQDWMNSYEMASIWNAVRNQRKIEQDILDAIAGLIERTIDRSAARHNELQANPEFIDGIWYTNAGQAYAYIARLAVLIHAWEAAEGDPDTRAWLKKQPFIIKRPMPLGMTLETKRKIADGRRRNREAAKVQSC